MSDLYKNLGANLPADEVNFGPFLGGHRCRHGSYEFLPSIVDRQGVALTNLGEAIL
jgi:hypothetical protein